MKISKRIVNILACALIYQVVSPGIALAMTEAPVEDHEQVTVEDQRARQDFIEQSLKVLIGQIETIDIILEDLALDITNNVIKTDKKSDLLGAIKSVRQHTYQLKQADFTGIDEQGLVALAILNSALIDHLTKSAHTGFKQLDPFEKETIRSPGIIEITPELIQTMTAKNGTKLMTLAKRAESAGLSWYNKVYRSLDDYLIQPMVKYKVPTFAGIATLTGLAALYLWYRSGSENSLLRSTIGWPMVRDSYGKIDMQWHRGLTFDEFKTKAISQGMNISEQELFDTYSELSASFLPKPYTKFGQVEDWFAQLNRGSMPLWSLITGSLVAQYTSAGVAVKKYTGKLLDKTRTFLRGGESTTKGSGFEEFAVSTTFDDLIGLDYAKSIGETILKYIEDPDRFARKKLVPEKGYLLYGDTRTGKSKFAEALCGEIHRLMKRLNRNQKFTFYKLDISDIKRFGISTILESFKHKAPCVLFIDEIDLLSLQRVGDKDMLSEFLTSMSGIMDSDPNKQVIILAATNRPENIDFALRQKGRFGKMIYFDHPTYENRKEYLVKRLSDLTVNIEEFDIDQLARETERCTYEDLNTIIKSAFQKAKINGVTVSQELLNISLDEEIRNIMFTNDDKLSQADTTLIAGYQAGHALAHYLVPTNERVARMTIFPVALKLEEVGAWDAYVSKPGGTKKADPIRYGKVFTYRPEQSCMLSTKEEKISLCKRLVAGEAAQQVLFGTYADNYGFDDQKKAFELAKAIVFESIDPKELPDAIRNEKLAQAYGLLQEYKAEMKELMNTHREQLSLLTHVVLETKILSGDEIEYILAMHEKTSKDHTEKESSVGEESTEEPVI